MPSPPWLELLKCRVRIHGKKNGVRFHKSHKGMQNGMRIRDDTTRGTIWGGVVVVADKSHDGGARSSTIVMVWRIVSFHTFFPYYTNIHGKTNVPSNNGIVRRFLQWTHDDLGWTSELACVKQ